MAVNLLFATVLLSVIGSTAYILLKLLLVASGNRISQNWRYHSVLAVALLYVLPIYKLWALVPIPHKSLPSIITVGGDMKPAGSPASPPGSGELLIQPAPMTINIDWEQVLGRAAALWVLVVIGLVLWNVWRLLYYRRLFEQVSTEVIGHLQQIAQEAACFAGVTSKVRLLVSPLVQSPTLVGFFRPTILLPSEHLPDNDARFILVHELTHFRRGDLWKKFLMNMIQCFHWFNPIIYLLNRDFAYWLETSCDEEVVSSLNCEQRKEYGYLLINYAPTARYVGPKLYVSFTSCRYKLKRRISTMMKSNKKSRSLLGLVLAVVLGVSCLATTALAANFTGNEGISQEDLPEGTALITVGECTHGTAYTSFNDEVERTPFDPTPYIKMIESGEIKPLSNNNLPEGASSLSDIDFTGTDGCPSINLAQIESGIAPVTNCDHTYCNAHQVRVHAMTTSGGCINDYYDATVCHKCGGVWTLAYDRTVSYRVCPH
ncbi:M56 family metallopeptidase [bacterium 1xD42-67]|nr:M56 family metallopeptidase [bacterium 1xD42-67]